MRRGRNRVHPLRDHARFGNVGGNFCAGQMASDPRFCALPHLDLNGRGIFKIIPKHAEPAGRDLYDGIFAVFVKILMQPAFARVVICSQFFRRARKAFVRIVTDRAVTHGRKHDGHFEFELRRQRVFQFAALVALDFDGMFAQKHLRFHGFAQRIDGRIGHLRGIDEHFIPKNRIFFRISHRREQNAAGICLPVHLVDRLVAPVCIDFIGIVRTHDLQRMRRAEADAAVTIHAFFAVRLHFARIGVVRMHEICALPLADAADNAAVGIPHDFVVGLYIHIHQPRPPL